MKFSLPKLNYNYSDLEPYIDALTMEIHYTKHHQAYISKLNVALESIAKIDDTTTIEEIISNLNKLPENIRNTVRNNGGGHFNHSFFFDTLKPSVQASESFLEKIKEEIGTFEDLIDQIKSVGLNRFGSGWVWLIITSEGKLKVVSTANQDNPLMDLVSDDVKGIPLLGIDVWEHAYYLKYQNKRDEYLDNILRIIDWGKVESRISQ